MNTKTVPGCPLQKKCGGCTYQGIAYEKQLEEKENLVRKLLKGICAVDPIVGMDEPFHYRNKVNATFKRLPDGRVISGTYAEGTHRVVEVEDCMIEDERADAIIGDIRKLLPSFKITVFNEDTGRGLLRHVLVRTGRKSGQVMVVLVLSNPVMPSKSNFVKELTRLHPEITTIVININNRKTSMILGDTDKVIYGKGFIEDELLGVTFRISPKSFYQVNPIQTEKLYSIAVEKAGLSKEDKVLDAYCGIGTIGLIAAEHAGFVTGVELNRDAIRDAISNAKNNNIKNVRFFANDAGKFMEQAVARGERPDVIFMDPPRSGLSPEFIDAVVKTQASRLVYISCNPETLAGDLKLFLGKGYEVKGGAVPVDMFPWTGHVETCCLLERLRNAKDHVTFTLDMEDNYRIKDAEEDKEKL